MQQIVDDFKKDLANRVGPSSGEYYEKIIHELDALSSATTHQEVQYHINTIQEWMSHLYVSSSDIQQNVSIRDFGEIAFNNLRKIPDIFPQTAREPAVYIDPSLIIRPIVYAAYDEEIILHNSPQNRDFLALVYTDALEHPNNYPALFISALDTVVPNITAAVSKAICPNLIGGFNNLIGDRGRESPEYTKLYNEINELNQLLNDPNLSPDIVQTRISNIELLMGEFYAANKDVQQHVSIKDFMTEASRLTADVVTALPVGTNPTLNPDRILGPIVHAAAAGTLERHDSAIKNAEDCKYLDNMRKDITANPADHSPQFTQDVSNSVEKFNVLDKFQLARIINDNPDMMVRYLKNAGLGKLGKATPEAIAAVGKMLDTFTSETTKKHMQEIMEKVNDTRVVHWYEIATHIANAIEWIKSGIESRISGYDEIDKAMGQLSEMYDIYGSLFKEEGRAPADDRTLAFLGKALMEQVLPEQNLLVANLSKSLDELIKDNGRTSREFQEVRNQIRGLEKLMATEAPTKEALQAQLDGLTAALAKLYTNNPSIQQESSLRAFSEGLQPHLKALASFISAESGVTLKADIKPALVNAIAAQPKEQIQAYGGTARQIDAQNYLSTVPDSQSAMQKFDGAKDNFKLAKLINEHPERVMRLMDEMKKQGGMMAVTSDAEGESKVATVLQYLCSDKTKEAIVAHFGEQGAIPTETGLFAAALAVLAPIILAIDKIISKLTGFDQEVLDAFKELNNITAKQHDVIKQYDEQHKQEMPARVTEQEIKEDKAIKSFVERVSKAPANIDISR